MIDETVWVSEHGMEETLESQLILSFRYIGAASAKLTVGAFGHENAYDDLYVGDFIKYSNLVGLFEVRLVKIGPGFSRAQLRIRQLGGPMVALRSQENSDANDFFADEEIKNIKRSMSEIKDHLFEVADLGERQKIFIESQFAHMESALARMGRKDWIVLAIGTFTNIIIGAALDPDLARALFQIAQRLLGWALGGVRLLPE